MKKAFLVTFCPTTRVVVDVKDENLEDVFEFSKVVKAAREQIQEIGIEEYLNCENIDEIILDEELPYPQDFDL